jgi:hypothetical protein
MAHIIVHKVDITDILVIFSIEKQREADGRWLQLTAHGGKSIYSRIPSAAVRDFRLSSSISDNACG